MIRVNKVFAIIACLILSVALTGWADEVASGKDEVQKLADCEVGEYSTLSELSGKKIATTTGSVYDLLAKEYIDDFISVSYSQLNSQIIALETGKVDGFFVDFPIGRFIIVQREKLTMVPEKIPCGDYAMMFSKDNPQLCAEFSQEIRKMKDSGELKKLQDKWFAIDESRQILPEVQPAERKIRLLVFAEAQPFAFIRNNRIVGYEVEVCILAANRLGYELEVDMVDISAMVESVNSGKCDIGAGCIIITPERQESVLFSESTYEGGIVVVERKKEAVSSAFSLSGWCRGTMKSLTESFEKTFIREARWKLIVRGLWITIAISVMSVLLGTVLALPLCMACRSRKKWMSGLGNGYISVIMGTPILVILMILYYVVFAKVDIKAEIVAILAFALDFAAYISVAFQSGIDSVPKGQWEAAMALGHNKSQTFFRFIVPQAVRIVLPVYRSEIVSILKATSVVGYIAIEDLTKMSDIIRSRTYEAFFPLISTAIIYFLVAQLLIIAIKKVEFRLNPDNHRNKLLQRRVE